MNSVLSSGDKIDQRKSVLVMKEWEIDGETSSWFLVDWLSQTRFFFIKWNQNFFRVIGPRIAAVGEIYFIKLFQSQRW
jgi:hypothetical protein